MSTNTASNERPTSTTAQLVRTAQQGCNHAFGELVSRFERMVYVVCLQRLRDHAEAQEVSQEVFMKALDRLHQLRDPAAFAGWLRSIAIRQSINRSTRRAPSVAVEPQVLQSVDGEADAPLDALLADERAEHVHAGLNKLATLDRKTLVAFYMHGQSLIEMSDAFSAPVGTIKRRLHVARKRLAQQLDYLQAV